MLLGTDVVVATHMTRVHLPLSFLSILHASLNKDTPIKGYFMVHACSQSVHSNYVKSVEFLSIQILKRIEKNKITGMQYLVSHKHGCALLRSFNTLGKLVL